MTRSMRMREAARCFVPTPPPAEEAQTRMSGSTMPWERVRLMKASRCVACGRLIPVGHCADVRHGERIGIYPEDPTTFCVPCTTPQAPRTSVQ